MIEVKDEILQVRSDKLFHDLFCKEDMNALEWAIMQILDLEYQDVHGKLSVDNIRLTRVNKKERNKYLDLILELDDEKILIELNNNFDGMYIRNFLYASNVLLNNYKSVDVNAKKLNEMDSYYKRVTRVLLINLNWYKDKKYINIPDKTIYEIPYSDFETGYLLKIINVNLEKFTKLCYDKTKESDKFYKLLTINNKRDLDSLIKEEELLLNYSKKLMELSSNKEFLEGVMDQVIEDNVEKQTAYLFGRNEGIEQGILQNKKEMIIKMHEKLSIEEISNLTGISISKIEKIINNQEK